MHTNEPKEDPLVDLGYDHRDVDYKRLTKAVIAFLSFGVGAALIGAAIYTNRFWVFQIPEPKPGINAELNRTTPPTGTPFIQDNVASKTDIMALRQAETKRMTGTGYTDESHQYVYIPVDRAMAMVAQRGVGNSPATQTGAQPATASKPVSTDYPGMIPAQPTNTEAPSGVSATPSHEQANPGTH